MLPPPKFFFVTAFCLLLNVPSASGADFSCDMIKDKKTRAACAENEKKKQIDPVVKARKDAVKNGKQLVANRMLDPAAVQFRQVVYVESDMQEKGAQSRHIVCGELNAKNSYGGYVGFTRFFVDYGTTGNAPIVQICNATDAAAALICLRGADLYCSEASRSITPEEELR